MPVIASSVTGQTRETYVITWQTPRDMRVM